MAIIETINDEYHFWEWLKRSDSSYKDNFSLEGAKAVQAWYEEYSEATGENVEFDPIAWCCDFSEYDSLADAFKEYKNDTESTENMLEYFQDNTTIIELDNGHVVIEAF